MKTSLRAVSVRESSADARTIVSWSTRRSPPSSMRRNAPTPWSGVQRTSTPALDWGTELTPTTACSPAYLATLATRPSGPTTTMTSSGAKRKRDRLSRSTSALAHPSGMPARTRASAATWDSWAVSTEARVRPRLLRTNSTWPRVE